MRSADRYRAVRPQWVYATGAAEDLGRREELAQSTGEGADRLRREQAAAAEAAPASGVEEPEDAAGAAGVRVREGGEPERGPEEVEMDVEVSEEHQDIGSRKVIKMHDPKLPSEEEVRMHMLCHLPYRSWCHHCVRGRGRERDHRRKPDEGVKGIPEYHLDYCFPGDEFGHKLAILVALERYSRMKKAVVVPCKGSTGMYAARMVMELISECGDENQDVILKTDQEPAIKFLVDDICTARTGARTICEMAPKGSKGSNGVVERAVQSVEQFIRTMKSALDERMNIKIDTLHPVLTWMCDYAGLLMNRMEVSTDGKTAYERVKGKRAEVVGLEFGEKVLWKYVPGGQNMKLKKIEARWGYGVFLGVRAKSGELIVADEAQGIVHARTVKRVPEGERWSANNLQWVKTVPWNKGEGDREADGLLPEYDVKAGPGRQLTSEEKEDIKTSQAPKIVHRAHLRKDDFEMHGYTDRCPGCSAILRGLKTQPHTAQCRSRMEQKLEKDVRIRNAKIRLKEVSQRQRDEKKDQEDEEQQAKKRRLQEIEDQAMIEEDPDKLAMLFELYRAEYFRSRTEEDGDSKRRKVEVEGGRRKRARMQRGHREARRCHRHHCGCPEECCQRIPWVRRPWRWAMWRRRMASSWGLPGRLSRPG